MKVLVDVTKCRAYANCVMESPEVFDVDDASGKVVLLVEEPDPALNDDVRAAAKSCPVHAITLVE